MKTKKKALLLAACAVMLVAVSVLGTLAYLTDNDKVTNTFTVGKVTLGDGQNEAGLDEALVNEYGQPINNDTDKTVVELAAAPRVQENDYKLLPGHEYVKDPTVHVKNDSENSYIFVKITNEIAAIEAKQSDEYDQIDQQILEKEWLPIEDVENVYYKEWTAPDDKTGTTDLLVFSEFEIDETKTADTLNGYAEKTIVVEAYAIQKDGFEANVAGAWKAVQDAYPSNSGN